jgi:HSP20 family protein
MLVRRGEWPEVIIHMQRAVERVMDDVASRKPPSVRFSPRTWQPAIDVYETGNDVVVLIELAGVKQDEVEVIVDNNILSIRGYRRDSKQGIKRTYSQMEILWGSFQREIPLPAKVNPNEVEAFYENGLLEVILPRLGRDEAHQIDIKVR